MIGSVLDWKVGSPGGLALVAGLWLLGFGSAVLRGRRRR